MSQITPWIADLLITNLGSYLVENFNTIELVAPSSAPSEYIRDSSNLLFAVRGGPQYTVYLRSWEVSQTGKSINALVTDSQISVHAAFLRTALDRPERESLRSATLMIGQILRLEAFEIRLADYVTPPKFSLFLRQFNVLSAAETYQQIEPPTIYSVKTASRYLDIWKRLEMERTMNPSPSSSIGLRSQVGDGDRSFDSDTENQDPTSVSQAQFATQIPLRKTPRKLARQAQRDVTPNNPIMSSSLDQLASQKKEHILRASVTKVTPETAHLNQHDVASSAPELTQQQIIAPPSGVYTEQHLNINRKAGTSNLSQAKQTSQTSPGSSLETIQPMPDCIAQLLRVWRKECHNGRYIPRRLQIIPKDQAKLLESDDRWQPALVGHVQRLGTIPLDMLNHLTAKADRNPEEVTAILQPPAEPAVEGRKDNNREPEEHLEDSASASEASEGEASESVDWSSSPPRLPPDSSPLQPSVIQDVELSSHQDLHAGDVDTVDSLVQDNAEKQHSSRNPARLDASVTVADRHNAYTSTDSRQSRRSEFGASDDKVLPASTNAPKLVTVTADLQKTVQVKRTPYHGKEVTQNDNPPDSSTLVVPGTFDERSLLRHKVLKKGNPIATNNAARAISEDSISNFEADSSEDDAVASHGISNDLAISSRDSRLRRDVYEFSSSDVLNGSRVSKLPNLVLSSKRRLDMDNNSSAKRSKTDGRTIRIESEESAYNSIDEARARYRRQVLGKIGRQKADSKQHHSPSVRPANVVEGASNNGSNRGGSVSSEYPVTQPKHHFETLDTHSSVHRIFVADPKISMTVPRNDNVSGSRKQRNELFDAFASSYPGYGGQKKNFEAALDLLRGLYLQERAPHRSLWDDFIFRHFHDYRAHLLEVMENSGNALPYERFYDEFVEEPTYLNRVVKPSHLSIGSAAPQSATRLSLPPVAIPIQTDSLLNARLNKASSLAKSVAADSSISNVGASRGVQDPTPQFEPSHLQAESVVQVETVVHQVNDAVPQDKEDLSQGSSASVQHWLTRAAGAESPILGTPEAMDKDIDVSMMDLVGHEQESNKPGASSSVPMSAESKKGRTLPWNKTPIQTSEFAIVPHSQVVKSAQRVIDSSTAPPMFTRRRHLNGVPSPSPKNHKNAGISATLQPLQRLREQLGTDRSTSAPARKQQPETAFTRFCKFYNEIPGEKTALKLGRNIRDEKLIDIFSWRN